MELVRAIGCELWDTRYPANQPTGKRQERKLQASILFLIILFVQITLTEELERMSNRLTATLEAITVNSLILLPLEEKDKAMLMVSYEAMN